MALDAPGGTITRPHLALNPTCFPQGCPPKKTPKIVVEKSHVFWYSVHMNRSSPAKWHALVFMGMSHRGNVRAASTCSRGRAHATQCRPVPILALNNSGQFGEFWLAHAANSPCFSGQPRGACDKNRRILDAPVGPPVGVQNSRAGALQGVFDGRAWQAIPCRL